LLPVSLPVQLQQARGANTQRLTNFRKKNSCLLKFDLQCMGKATALLYACHRYAAPSEPSIKQSAITECRQKLFFVRENWSVSPQTAVLERLSSTCHATSS